jgi:hypothetical protein
VRITGRARVDGLLGAEEAVRLQLVAGARNHRNRLVSPSRWRSSDRQTGPINNIGSDESRYTVAR